MFCFSISRAYNNRKREIVLQLHVTAGGHRPEAFICFKVFGARDEAYSPSITKMGIQVFDLR